MLIIVAIVKNEDTAHGLIGNDIQDRLLSGRHRGKDATHRIFFQRFSHWLNKKVKRQLKFCGEGSF